MILRAVCLLGAGFAALSAIGFVVGMMIGWMDLVARQRRGDLRSRREEEESRMRKSIVGLLLGVALLGLGAGEGRAGLNDKWCVGDDDVCVGQDGQLRSAKPYEAGSSTHAAIATSTQVVLTNEFMTVASTGGLVLVGSAPTVKDTYPSGRAVASGTCITLRGSSDANAIIVQDDDTAAGTRLELQASTRTLGFNDMIRLCYHAGAGRWLEAWYSNLD